jgi:hypothetical protein
VANLQETMSVITAEAGQTRAWAGAKELDVKVLGENVKRFLQQVEQVLAQSPAMLGEFRFEEIEVHAEVTAKGTLSLLGTGGEASATGGLKFVFRRQKVEPHG